MKLTFAVLATAAFLAILVPLTECRPIPQLESIGKSIFGLKSSVSGNLGLGRPMEYNNIGRDDRDYYYANTDSDSSSDYTSHDDSSSDDD